MRPSLAVLLCLPLALASPALAGDPAGSAPEAAAAAKVRASIPVPEEEKHLAFEFTGDLSIAGEWGGTVHYEADTGTYKDQPVWVVTEEVVRDFGGSKTTTATSCYLSRDLTFLRGDWQRTTPEGEVHVYLVRTPEGITATRERTTEKGTEALPPVTIAASANATLGRTALLLFLKYAPAKPAAYALPLVDLDAAVPAENEHAATSDPAPARVEVKGAAKFGSGRDALDSWMALVTWGRRVSEVHLRPKDRALLGVEGLVPPGVREVPKGAAGTKAEYADDKPAETWRAAFLKLGHGYHLAIPKLMEDAVDWKAMYDYEVSIFDAADDKGWPKERPLEEFKKAYIDEFMKRSKHRPRAEADALLAMTIATATQKTEPDGTVVLATHPEFGGNVFHMRKVDKAWYVVRIDQ